MQINLFSLYILFTISWFLHLPARIPALAAVRFDLLLVVIIFIGLLVSEPPPATEEDSRPGRALKLLLLYLIVTIPFVEWPGSVIKNGIPNFVKASVFYFFSVRLLNSERRLRTFFYIFLACQAFRVMEPLYLHVTEGYWGDTTFMGADMEMMSRLAGAPQDTINPNGLAFVICTTLSLHYFLSRTFSLPVRIFILLSYPLFLYALLLTASRTGLLALGVTMTDVFMKSRHKIFLILTFSLAALLFLANLTPMQQERYLSIGRKDVRGASTAKIRITGIVEDFKAGLNRPFFGHGIGTSFELNFNSMSKGLVAHNLYVEIFQELGGAGLLLYGYFLYAILKNLNSSVRKAKQLPADLPAGRSLVAIADALQTFMYMNLLFAVASYGLSTYTWYLLGGSGVALNQLITTAGTTGSATDMNKESAGPTG